MEENLVTPPSTHTQAGSLVVTAIEPQKRKRDRYNIHADGEYIASLGAEAVVRAGIKVGSVISQSTLEAAILADNVQYAFDIAAGLLAHGMRTRGELMQRLKERGIVDAAVEPAMDKLASYGYVDDAAYAKEFVRSDIEAGRWGRIAVVQRLREKKLPREIIDEAMISYTEEDEKQNAKRQLDALASKGSGDQRQLKQKAFATLTRRGFSYDIISSVLSDIPEQMRTFGCGLTEADD